MVYSNPVALILSVTVVPLAKTAPPIEFDHVWIMVFARRFRTGRAGAGGFGAVQICFDDFVGSFP